MNSQPSITQVFVYGTLKPGESNYKIYCQGKTIAEIPAYTRGKLYQLAPGYPGMTKGSNKIVGYLLYFADKKILKNLDRLEGYDENRTFADNDYYRLQVAIYTLKDEPLGKAWCYLMSPDKIEQFQGKPIESKSWQPLLS